MSMNFNQKPMYALYPTEPGEDTLYLMFVGQTLKGGGYWVISNSNHNDGRTTAMDSVLFKVKASFKGQCQPYLEQATPWYSGTLVEAMAMGVDEKYKEDILIETKCVMRAPHAPKKPPPTPATPRPTPGPTPLAKVNYFKKTVAGKLVLPKPVHLGCFSLVPSDLKKFYNPHHGASPVQCSKACQVQNLWDPAAKYNSAMLLDTHHCYCATWNARTFSARHAASTMCTQPCLGGHGSLSPTCGGKHSHVDLLWITNQKPLYHKANKTKGETEAPTPAPLPTPMGELPAIFGTIPTPAPPGGSMDDDDHADPNAVPTVAYSDHQFWDLYNLLHSNATKFKNTVTVRDRWRIEHSKDWNKLLLAKVNHPQMHLPVAPDLPKASNKPFWKLWNKQKSPAPTPHLNSVSGGRNNDEQIDTRDDDDKLSGDSAIQNLPSTDDDNKY